MTTQTAVEKAAVTLDEVRKSRQLLADLIEEFDHLAAPPTSRYFGDVSRAATHVLYARWVCHSQLVRRYCPGQGGRSIQADSRLEVFNRSLDKSDLVFRELMMTWRSGEAISCHPERFYQSASKVIMHLKNEEVLEKSSLKA